MPFGLKNAPSTFQRAMNAALTGLQGMQCYVYLDDIVIYASDIEEHTKELESVFNRLRQNNLLLQPDKCEFMRKEVAYLGHIITRNGLAPNPDKIRAISNYPRPENQKQIKQFLGLIGHYRRFIKDFSKFARPLNLLLRKDSQFQWTRDHHKSFEYFKYILTHKPLLQFPDFSKEFLLTTDASSYTIGAILSQGEIGQDKPIAYASRSLNKAEINYSTIHRELLAIVWAVQHFRPYLYGRKFTILTDHRPLSWLFSCKDPSSRLIRWRLKLEEFDYVIKYKPGRVNSNVDALSRNPTDQVYAFPINSKNRETYSLFIKFHYENQTIPDIEIIKENIMLKYPNSFIFRKI